MLAKGLERNESPRKQGEFSWELTERGRHAHEKKHEKKHEKNMTLSNTQAPTSRRNVITTKHHSASPHPIARRLPVSSSRPFAPGSASRRCDQGVEGQSKKERASFVPVNYAGEGGLFGPRRGTNESQRPGPRS